MLRAAWYRQVFFRLPPPLSLLPSLPTCARTSEGSPESGLRTRFLPERRRTTHCPARVQEDGAGGRGVTIAPPPSRQGLCSTPRLGLTREALWSHTGLRFARTEMGDPLTETETFKVSNLGLFATGRKIPAILPKYRISFRVSIVIAT